MTERVPVPVYRGTIIACCPDCGNDLQPDGPNYFWCPPCRRSWDFTQVIPIDETEYDRD